MSKILFSIPTVLRHCTFPFLYQNVIKLFRVVDGSAWVEKSFDSILGMSVAYICNGNITVMVASLEVATSHAGHVPNPLKFAFGGLSGIIAATVVHPLDLIKFRMQMSGERGTPRLHKNFIAAFSHVLRQEGVFALYSGLTATWLRQSLYSTTRLGIYTELFEIYRDGHNATDPPYHIKAIWGLSAGAAGAFASTPADVCLVRMASDGRLPITERRGYKNVLDALIRITREEGVLAVYRGSLPTISRAMVVNGTQLATYSQAKQFFISHYALHDNVFIHCISSLTSGLATSLVSMPFDVIKTRIQNMRTINGVPEYRGILDCLRTVVYDEGILALWKGLAPYYFRIAPHTVVMFVALEQFSSLYRTLVLRSNTHERTL